MCKYARLICLPVLIWALSVRGCSLNAELGVMVFIDPCDPMATMVVGETRTLAGVSNVAWFPDADWCIDPALSTGGGEFIDPEDGTGKQCVRFFGWPSGKTVTFRATREGTVHFRFHAEDDAPDPPRLDTAVCSVRVVQPQPGACCAADGTCSPLREAECITAGGTFRGEGSDCMPADIAGVWIGTYSCNDACNVPFGGDITITITQNGSAATYTDDSGITYSGFVCGNVFAFTLVTPSLYTESGTLTLLPDGTAIKESTFNRNPPFDNCNRGTCVDMFTRVP